MNTSNRIDQVLGSILVRDLIPHRYLQAQSIVAPCRARVMLFRPRTLFSRPSDSHNVLMQAIIPDVPHQLWPPQRCDSGPGCHVVRKLQGQGTAAQAEQNAAGQTRFSSGTLTYCRQVPSLSILGHGNEIRYKCRSTGQCCSG